MKTWQKVVATLGVAVAVVVIDVIRKEIGIVLGGLPYMLFYGVLLCLPVALIWKTKRKPISDGGQRTDAGRAQGKPRKLPSIPKGVDVLAARLAELDENSAKATQEASLSADEISVLRAMISEYKGRKETSVLSDEEVRRRNLAYIDRMIKEHNG